MPKKEDKTFAWFGLFVIGVVVIGISAGIFLYNHLKDSSLYNFGGVKPDSAFELEQFKSVDEFNEYLNAVESTGLFAIGSSVREDFAKEGKRVLAPAIQNTDSVEHSTTNVQVVGIDEKDVVKTDGENIYFSGQNWGWYRDASEYGEAKVEIVRSFPLEDLEKVSEIKRSGEMLFFEENLMVLDFDGIYAYDVSDAKNPKESWNVNYDESFSLVEAKLFDDEIFLVLNDSEPSCPSSPIKANGYEESIACSDIYYSPDSPDSETMFVVYKIGARDGEIKNSLSFLGSSMNTIVYMSSENIFVTHNLDGDLFDIQYRLVSENKDLFNERVIEDLERVRDYEINLESKLVEYERIMERFKRRLDSDGELKFKDEFANRVDEFYLKVARELSFTGIMKIDNKSLDVKSTSKVPGLVSNQFALDEYDGFLRIATTVGAHNWGVSSKTLSDIYILDSKMKVVGKILDLGDGEGIYSSRFIGERGYIVTLREIDPFYVLDLSNPNKLEISGELKIPGYPSYVHKLSDDTLLGIIAGDTQVKLSLFDVSDVKNPSEKDSYLLEDSWSDILITNRAFIVNPEKKIFFMPGIDGGYIFSYGKGKLELIKSVRVNDVRRALFIDKYLYIIADEELVVLDNSSWDRVDELKFKRDKN